MRSALTIMFANVIADVILCEHEALWVLANDRCVHFLTTLPQLLLLLLLWNIVAPDAYLHVCVVNCLRTRRLFSVLPAVKKIRAMQKAAAAAVTAAASATTAASVAMKSEEIEAGEVESKTDADTNAAAAPVKADGDAGVGGGDGGETAAAASEASESAEAKEESNDMNTDDDNHHASEQQQQQQQQQLSGDSMDMGADNEADDALVLLATEEEALTLRGNFEEACRWFDVAQLGLLPYQHLVVILRSCTRNISRADAEEVADKCCTESDALPYEKYLLVRPAV